MRRDLASNVPLDHSRSSVALRLTLWSRVDPSIAPADPAITSHTFSTGQVRSRSGSRPSLAPVQVRPHVREGRRVACYGHSS
jgi:hypothetical protein